jgi:GDPmannose 4,6-dehydratase
MSPIHNDLLKKSAGLKQMKTKKALITGITGQDGSYLAELLLSLGYEVHGVVRRVALEDPNRRFNRIEHLLDRLTLHAASLESYPSIFHIFSRHEFDECYHLAAQSFVAESFADGFSTMSTNINGTHYMLAALRELQPNCRFYFAGSSEMFGKVHEVPQKETTPFHPRSPYGISKVAGFDLTRNYREAYGMFCVSGILFNHESPRRGFEFVTRKITSGVARIYKGLASELRLGNLDARRDWGHAKDYVRAMRLMLQQDEPEDLVVATGESHTVREFCKLAFAEVGLDYRDYVVEDEAFYRPAEVELLVGNSSKARTKLGWEPQYSFSELVRDMVKRDLSLVGEPFEAPVLYPDAQAASTPPDQQYQFNDLFPGAFTRSLTPQHPSAPGFDVK